MQVAVRECLQSELDAKYGIGVKQCKSQNESDSVAGDIKLYIVI